MCVPQHTSLLFSIKNLLIYPRKEISTPAATAEPITPDIFEDMQ